MGNAKTSKSGVEKRTQAPAMRGIAERLIAYEAKENPAPPNAPAAFGGVVDKFRPLLVVLTGLGGFRSLLGRALELAGGEARWLRAVHVKPEGTLEIPADMTGFSRKEIAEGEVALVAQLLELLGVFIGEPLTLRLVEDVWPDALKDRSISSKEKK